MTPENQKKFYKLLGDRLTSAMKRRSMDVTDLHHKSGEQHKTIQSIMEGHRCSLHHAVWLKNILGVDINEIIKDMEGNTNGDNKKEIEFKYRETSVEQDIDRFI